MCPSSSSHGPVGRHGSRHAGKLSCLLICTSLQRRNRVRGFARSKVSPSPNLPLSGPDNVEIGLFDQHPIPVQPCRSLEASN